MNDAQLLQALEKEGLLSADAALKLGREAELGGQTVEELIYSKRLIDDGKVAEVKSKILGIPYRKINAENFDEALVGFIPEETVRTYKVVPIGREKELLVAGMVHPNDSKAQEILKFMARRNRLNLGIYLISQSDWQAVLRKYSPYKSDVEAALKGLDLKQEGGRRLVELEKVMGVEEAPVIRIVADTLREAVQAQASDIHIEPQQSYLRVRFRIDGKLKEVTSLPFELSQSVVSRVKVVSNLKIDETRIPQDGRFRTKILDREVDFRVSTFPTPLGEKVAIRVLDPTTGLKSLDKLGLTGKNAESLKAGIEKPFGMILITGPTGSGKTTTLYAILQLLNKENVNIVSLEDPVEYSISGVNQSQVQPEIGYDFASGLRQILRQDPDVILVGEIRDNETAALAIHAALTGHIVLSTLHTNNAAGAIPRLIDMEVGPFLIPSALNMVIAQRLVAMLCGACKKQEEAPPQIQKLLKKALGDLPSELSSAYKEPYKIYKAEGCPKCGGKGVLGRAGLFELFSISPAMEDIILTGPTMQKILAAAKKEGMITLRQDGVLKALQGLVLIEEVIRETDEL